MIRDQYRQFEEQRYPQLLAKLKVWASPITEIQKPVDSVNTANSDNDSAAPVKKPQPQVVAARSINIAFDKAWLVDEIDVDRYLEQVKKAWLKEIEAGKQVQV